ncbi:NAD(P)-dependent oxidoreductase [Paenibacillaceae bacterium]|nr:NAD(P)-dependent oxidoreductase [Paenibacillaceae bacterium]
MMSDKMSKEETTMNRVLVTGAAGKLGRYAMKELAEHGYSIVATDNRPYGEGRRYGHFVQADLGQLGEVYGLVAGVDAILHLAAVPNPINYTPERIFSNNIMSTYHVMEAASKLGINKVVAGSSESAFGFCWAKTPFAPDYFPVDEQHPLLPQESYGLSKVVGELIGDMFNRREGMDVLSLRYSMIVAPEEYRHFINRFNETANHHRIMWSYIDIRDAAEASRLALEASDTGSVQLNVTADDVLSSTPTEELLRRHYPQVTDIREQFVGTQALVSNRAARQLLNWEPRYSWKSAVETH